MNLHLIFTSLEQLAAGLLIVFGLACLLVALLRWSDYRVEQELAAFECEEDDCPFAVYGRSEDEVDSHGYVHLRWTHGKTWS